MTKTQIGSLTAKGGFLNEADICNKIVDFKNDNEARLWLEIMGYSPEKIDSIEAIQIPVRINKRKAIGLGVTEDKYEETIRYKKADVQVRINIVIDNVVYVENISLKKANRSAGFNQIDKRPVSTYKNMWGFDDEIEHWLKLFTGEILPKDILGEKELSILKDRDKRRLFLYEMPSEIVEKIKRFFEENKFLIISDMIKGRGGLCAEWFLVTRKDTKDGNKIDWILKDINTTCNFYAKGEVQMSPRGSLKIGKITMQRKGGTPDPTSLQFKLNPLEIFKIDEPN
ncbi:MAG: type II restriction endonuclease [Sulfurovum sp.]